MFCMGQISEAGLQESSVSRQGELSCVKTADGGILYCHGIISVLKSWSSWGQHEVVGTIEGEVEPRRDIVSQGGTSGAKDHSHHNRCCGWWLHRNAPGLPRQQNGLATCLSLNIHPGQFVSPDTWCVPSITICGRAGDGTEHQAEPNLAFQHPHHLSLCWSSSERSGLHNGMKRSPFQAKQRYLWIKVKFSRSSKANLQMNV